MYRVLIANRPYTLTAHDLRRVMQSNPNLTIIHVMAA